MLFITIVYINQCTSLYSVSRVWQLVPNVKMHTSIVVNPTTVKSAHATLVSETRTRRDRCSKCRRWLITLGSRWALKKKPEWDSVPKDWEQPWKWRLAKSTEIIRVKLLYQKDNQVPWGWPAFEEHHRLPCTTHTGKVFAVNMQNFIHSSPFHICVSK